MAPKNKKRLQKLEIKLESPKGGDTEEHEINLTNDNEPEKNETKKLKISKSKNKNLNIKTDVEDEKSQKSKLCKKLVVTESEKTNESSNNVESDTKNILKQSSSSIIPRHLKFKKYIGAHTSINGGLWKAIEETLEMGGTAFGLFLKSQRTWKCKELDEKSVVLFKEKLNSSGILPQMIVPHGSYLLNCGSANEENLQKTRECLLDELLRCEKLGIPMYNFHPGSSKGTSTEHCIDLIAETINLAHEKTTSVITLIENMSKQGNTIGGDFNQLKLIIDKVKDKTRIGICFDTCHAFAAGYDLKSEDGYEKTKKEFDDIIGRHYLKAVHLNDSKGELDCHLDRHENIGKGKLGMGFFKRMMCDPYFNDIPLILETPECDYQHEINLLYDLCS